MSEDQTRSAPADTPPPLPFNRNPVRAIEQAISVLREILQRHPEVRRDFDCPAFIEHELEPALEAARAGQSAPPSEAREPVSGWHLDPIGGIMVEVVKKSDYDALSQRHAALAAELEEARKERDQQITQPDYRMAVAERGETTSEPLFWRISRYLRQLSPRHRNSQTARMLEEAQRDLSRLREMDEAESKLASLADTIASALRNTGMSGLAESMELDSDLRERVWQLSYRANEHQQRADALSQRNAALAGELATAKWERDRWKDNAERVLSLHAQQKGRAELVEQLLAESNKVVDAARKILLHHGSAGRAIVQSGLTEALRKYDAALDARKETKS